MTTLSALYADLSGYYDRFCLEVDYAAQCAFADRVARTFGDSGGKDYLDLACGTGQLLAHMMARGYTGTGLDNSQAMLDLAARRCPEAHWLCCDLATFDTPGRFDLITCFLYSMHYAYPRPAFQETLRRAHAALRPGGVLLFDLVDKAGIGERDAVTQHAEGDAHFTFRSGWRYAGSGDALDLQVRIEREDASGVQRWEDRHTMSAIGIAEVRLALQAIGFEATVLERDFTTLREWSGKNYNVMMVGVKPEV
ncbi:MAG TPA: class I SAM-dependent methyltransferase [Moraxellaceae bacterium]|nr:class I SAM-dependent methyltransferase [Moraxellaceae bacterium]